VSNICHITIDMDKPCVECGKGGAQPSGLCLSCVSKALGSKPMKTWQGKAARKRFKEIMEKTRKEIGMK
jgi:hypothetical protein